MNIFLIVFSSSLYADTKFIDSLINQAREKELYKSRQWEVLMHYKKFAFRPYRSLVDDESFFLAEDGKTNPQAELEASIKEIFANDKVDDDNLHPYCRYTGRREYLIESLGIDRAKLPKRNCSEYDKYFKKLDPSSATLIFPFMYMKNPASMFGHTMLRINNSKNDPLTSYSVTFAANLPENINAFDYMFKGMFGGYFGYYNVKEYHKTIFEYGNTEKRDIWEYDLNLTKEETIRMFNHLWEMQNIGSDYWFIDENCSYNLLLLLENARPEEQLSVSIFWEAPPDTVKLIYSKGMVTNIKYRPSHIKVLENYSRGLSSRAIKLAQDVAVGKKTPQDITVSEYSDKEKVAIFDLAIEAMQFEFLKDKTLTEEKFNKYKADTIALLSERAKIKLPSRKKIKEPVSPHKGHDITRFKIGVGVKNYKEVYNDIGFRLAFNSLEDIDFGYIPNSQLSVLDVNLRYNYMTGKLTIPEAALVSIGSYAPITRLMPSISWRLDIAGEQKETMDSNYFTPYIRGGVGATFSYDDFYFWLMGDIDLAFSPIYDTYAGIGLGGNVGLSYRFDYMKILAKAYYRNYVLGGFGEEFGAEGLITFPITQNNTLDIKYDYKNYWKKDNQELGLYWNIYF